MKKIVRLLGVAILGLAAIQAAARAPVPIVNHENVLVEGKATTGDVRKAIMAASTATGRKWAISEPQPGRLVATYSVRTHTVVAEIRYTATQYSVVYKDSINMKYDGGGMIHPFYNQWVAELVQAIRVGLSKG